MWYVRISFYDHLLKNLFASLGIFILNFLFPFQFSNIKCQQRHSCRRQKCEKGETIMKYWKWKFWKFHHHHNVKFFALAFGMTLSRCLLNRFRKRKSEALLIEFLGGRKALMTHLTINAMLLCRKHGKCKSDNFCAHQSRRHTDFIKVVGCIWK